MKKKVTVVVLLAVLLGMAGTTLGQTNLVANGQFNGTAPTTGTGPVGNWRMSGTGTQSTSWAQVTGKGYSNQNAMAMCYGNDTLTQDLATSSGSYYSISFYFKTNTLATTNTIGVYFGQNLLFGGNIATFSQSFPAWFTVSADNSGPGGTTALVFTTSWATAHTTAYLSNVSVYSQIQIPTVLGSFTNSNGNGPPGNLTLSGTTLFGVAADGGTNGLGVIFRIPTSGGSPTALYSFDSANPNHGEFPCGTLALSGSTLYGMTTYGGANGNGVIFSIPTSGGTPTVLYSFDGTTHGGNPGGSLILSGSTLYGMTQYGGDMSLLYGMGGGVIFSMPTSVGTPTVLFTFDGTNHGENPAGSLILSGSTLYGMTYNGGSNTNSYGVIFSIPTSGGTPTVLASFTNSNGAACGDLTLSGSTLYGLTEFGGSTSLNNGQGCGTIFSIPISGGKMTVLGSFTQSNGAEPHGSLTLSRDGSTLYGMTSCGGNTSLNYNNGFGTIFSIPTSGGSATALFLFDGPHGYDPLGSFILSPDGSTLYGVTSNGGSGTLGPGTGYGAVISFSLPLPNYTITVNQTTGGTVTLSPTQATYVSGTTVNILATAAPGYTFSNWVVTGDTAVSKTASLTTLNALSASVTLSAVFSQETYSGTETNPGGSISVSSSGPYTYGQVITVTASANTGYIFKGWSVTGSSSLSNSAALSTSLTVYEDFTLTANFMVRPLGDINGDGVLDGNDLTILNNRLNNFDISPYSVTYCDLNDDGYVTTSDRVILRKILNGVGP